MRPKHICINIVAAAGAVTFLTAESLAVQKFSGWSEPVNLGPLVNSEFSDTYPAVSQKGLSLYFASNRPGSLGVDLWVARRASVDHPWEPPVNLGPNVNTSSVEDAPAISRDGHWLFFDSTRPDGHGALDLWVSWRAHTNDDFGWLPAVNLGAGINTNVLDAGPAPLENDDARMPLLFFVSNRAGGIGFNDIYVSRGDGDGPYTAGTPVTELNSPQGEFRPTIRYDGLEIVFGSNRPASVPGSALWTSHRTRVDEPWSPPVELGPPVNGGFFENSPYLSRDGRALYFSAVRPDRIGGFDLYVSTRSRNTGG
jgi:hypothetical protein